MDKQNIRTFREFSEDKLTKRVIFKEGKTTVFLLNFSPGQTLPKHKHPGAHLQLLVLEGKGQFIIDGQEISVTKDDVIFVEGEEEVSFTNNSNDQVSLYVTMSRTPDESYNKDF